MREKGNQIKEELLGQPNTDLLAAVVNRLTTSAPVLRGPGANISNQQKLKTQQVHILDFKPFFCDIKDLTEGGNSLKDIYKRQMISPFNLYYNQTDMLEVLAPNVRTLKKHFAKKTRSKVDKDEQARQEKALLLSDNNFRYFTKTELNLDLAEIQISFNDMVILKGISLKFNQMNTEFAEQLEKLADKVDSQSAESDYEMSEEEKSNSDEGDDINLRKFEQKRQGQIRLAKQKSKLLQADRNILKIQRQFSAGGPLTTSEQRVAKRAKVYTSQSKLMKDIGRPLEEECNVEFDDSEETQEQLRRNMSQK